VPPVFILFSRSAARAIDINTLAAQYPLNPAFKGLSANINNKQAKHKLKNITKPVTLCLFCDIEGGGAPRSSSAEYIPVMR
jgi:hypothetical protein